MIFSELYSAYYIAVARILEAARCGTLTERSLEQLIREHAFSESVLTVAPALKSGQWQLLFPDLTTPLRHRPTMPLTTLQKRWLKAILDDPRIKLFDLHIDGLDDIDPLFDRSTYTVFDRYLDGDDYEDEGYIARFRAILAAIRSGEALTLTVYNRYGRVTRRSVLPRHLEYSVKDDKFRLQCTGNRDTHTVNLSRVLAVSPYQGDTLRTDARPLGETRSLTLRLTDERNTLERVMLHFAHFEKSATKLDETHYEITLRYDSSDETELIIRVLSFGPTVEVISPLSFRELIKDRLIKQMQCELS